MIKNIVIDCDGVLTDGGKIVDENGKRTHIRFHSRDNEAINDLQRQGFRVIIVTASKFAGIRNYWYDRCRVEVYSLPENKDKVFELTGIDPKETLAIGDDIIDTAFLNSCAQSYVVADAHPVMKRFYAKLNSKGGEGVMAEVFDLVTSNEYYLNGTTSIT